MLSCPHCNHENLDESQFCSTCGTALASPAPTPSAVIPAASSPPLYAHPVAQMPVAAKKKRSLGRLVLLIVASCAILSIIGAATGRSGGESSSGGSNDARRLEFDAYYMCKEFVSKRLKAPATAEFARLSGSKVTMLSSDNYRVTSYVDAENSFGAKIRTEFVCTVTSTGDDTWRLVDLQMSQ